MITEIRNFITEEENIKLKTYFDLSKMTDSETTNGTPGFLIAKGRYVNPKDDEFLKNLLNRMLSYVGKDWEYVDYVNFTIYPTGGKFKPHSDFLDLSSAYNIEELQRGGQRDYTFLLYINDDCEGGETNFPMVNQKIDLEKNKLVYWCNILEDGSPNMITKHESKIVSLGEKYLVGVWVRHQKVHTKKTII
jgi:prolyl 4-hydroxylase